MQTDISELIRKGHGGLIIGDFDDGHIPENLPLDTPTQLVTYPWLFEETPPRVNVFQRAIPESIVDAAYRKTAREAPHPSWGDYVSLPQIEAFWKCDEPGRSFQENEEFAGDFHLAVQLAAHYLRLTLDSNPTLQFQRSEDGSTQAQQTEKSALYSRDDLPKIHGVAVWALCAKAGSQVPYHLDYAEQFRYESNVVVPPLLAGTLQCTRDKVTGGDFCLSLEGITHYRRHGYKTNRAAIHTNQLTRIPYRFNQLSCHYGNLPHLSTKVQEINGTQMRVIVGFNAFGHDFGPIVQEAPEHSDAFRRKVQAQRALHKNRISLQLVQQNKGLSKLLVLAKRERIKQEYEQAQADIINDLPRRLPATVQHLMTLYCNGRLCWPSSPVDVQVFLHHKVEEGKLQVLNSESLPAAASSKALVSPLALIDLQ